MFYLNCWSILKAMRGYDESVVLCPIVNLVNFVCFYCHFNLLQEQCRSIMQDQMLIALSLWSRHQMKISCEVTPDLQTSMTWNRNPFGLFLRHSLMQRSCHYKCSWFDDMLPRGMYCFIIHSLTFLACKSCIVPDFLFRQ